MIAPVAQTHGKPTSQHTPILGWFLAFMMIANSALLLGIMGAYTQYRQTIDGEHNTALEMITTYLAQHPPYSMILINITLFGAFIWIRTHYVQPITLIIAHVSELRARMQREASLSSTPVNLRRTALEFGQLIAQAIDAQQDREQLQTQLANSQEKITLLLSSQQWMANHSYAETQSVFNTIQSYAHYLEDLVAQGQVDDSIRYDYDEVCEATHNLQFLMQGMTLLLEHETHPDVIRSVNCNISDILGQYLLRITPSLERRAMQLNSEQFTMDIIAFTPPALLQHSLWAMLYACLHYAADDTSLYVAARQSEKDIIIEFNVSDSCPTTLSTTERGEYLHALTTHNEAINMFAHTLAAHPNVQLATRLAELMGGTIVCIPTHAHGCTLCLRLPR